MNDLGHTVEYLFEPSWKFFSLDPNAAAGHITNTTRRGFQNAVTGNAGTGIYPENTAQRLLVVEAETRISDIAHGIDDVVADIRIGIDLLNIIQVFQSID